MKTGKLKSMNFDIHKIKFAAVVIFSISIDMIKCKLDALYFPFFSRIKEQAVFCIKIKDQDQVCVFCIARHNFFHIQ